MLPRLIKGSDSLKAVPSEPYLTPAPTGIKAVPPRIDLATIGMNPVRNSLKPVPARLQQVGINSNSGVTE